ncbi:TolC family protein [Aquimarina sp. 2201CG5-10]|uniref:TolC family protein n=1 Tax=Aquimarina callyspongiae TaxID=3098150 RepID=UPI002AB47D92|nr:TolC family protein [Aquimarina sp. 2201CG5-10]MDY8136687.1 TolC family protein [Aquimarina sp. 2201CG5-10]
MMRIKISILVFTFLGIMSSQAQEKKWTLRQCVEHALENNITIKQSALDIEVAEINESDAIGNFLPNLNASASNSWRSGLATNPITNANSTATFRSSSYGVNVGVTLFDGLRNLRQLQRAKLNKLLSQYNLGKSKDDIALFVANSYLQVLLNKESLKVVEKQHDITLEQLKRTKDLVDAGVLPENDLLEIEATSADELTRIVQAENAVLIARVGLAQTLLIKEYESFDIAEQEYLIPSADILNKSIEEIRTTARESRYEVQIAEQNKLLAEKDLQIARGAYYPTLSGSFNYGTSEVGTGNFVPAGVDPDNPVITEEIGFVGSSGESVFTSRPNILLQETGPTSFIKQLYENDGISYGVSLSVPIFNGFSTRNNVKRSKINVKRTAFQLEQAELDLDSNVYQAYLDAKGSAEAYEASQVAVKAQEKAYEYAKDRYDVGLINAFDFSQSKFRLENAQSNAVQAKFDYIFKIKVLELYFGIKIADIKL